jgi:sugar fermentation stimulation protein A
VRFEQPLVEGTLIKRQKTFVADVMLNNGEEVAAHCANPGSLIGCAEPGSKVLLSVHENPRSKFRHHLEIIYAGRTPVAVHTGRPASVIAEAITDARIIELAGYASLRRDATIKVKNGTRIDLIVEGNALRPCYMKIENVTLARENVAFFPDANVLNGMQVMQDLTNLVREGNRAMLMFLAQRADVEVFRPAEDIDAEYTQALRDAVARGVEAVCYRTKVTRKGIELDKKLPVEIGEA